MAIKKYSKKKHGSKKLAKNFRVSEFGCPGTDTIYIDERLPKHLQKLRDYFEKQAKNPKTVSITITSGYRSPAHNRKVGGSSNSRHLEGRAVDVNVWMDGKRVASKYIMCAAQDLGFIGIGCISTTAAHLDFKKGGTYRYDERKRNKNGYFLSFSDCYKYFVVKKKSSSGKPSSGKTMYVKAKSGLNVRNKASITGKKIGVLKNGTKVTVIEAKGSWCRIGTGKWVHKKYLSTKK